MKVVFYIVVVCFNAGDKLRATLNSILEQDYSDYKIIVKDGVSGDDSYASLERDGFFAQHDNIVAASSRDKGIYDGMNQAIDIVRDMVRSESDECMQYVQFLNCGDFFHDKDVLKNTANAIMSTNLDKPAIYYGDQFNLQTGSVVSSAPVLDDFALYRNVPCHQVCFYDVSLFMERGYDIRYIVRADYEHFLNSVYEQKAETVHMDIVVSDYEGGGFSETKKNRRLSESEHREITGYYQGSAADKYRLIMILTFSGVRRRLAESKTFSKVYNKIKTRVYTGESRKP